LLDDFYMAEKKRAGRKRNPNPGKKVDPVLPADTYACLQYLADLKRFGANPNEVARYMIFREIDDLTRADVIPKVLPPRARE
jgi:hypothetical protein